MKDPLHQEPLLQSLASALDVTVGDLIGEPSLLDWSADSSRSTVPALRNALMNYRQITPLLGSAPTIRRPSWTRSRSQIRQNSCFEKVCDLVRC